MRVTAIVLALLAPAAAARAQSTLSLGTMRTAAEAAAVRLAVRATSDLSDIVSVGHPAAGAKRTWGLVLTPDISILTGEADALNGVVAKLTGNVFPAIHLADGVPDPDQNLLLLVPLSVGAESDRSFRHVAALLEMGIMPFWKHGGVSNALRIRPGLFVQAGYKFGSDSAATGPSGATDQSAEATGAGLFRLKAILGVDLHPISLNRRQVAIKGDATGWYDIAHSKTYYRLEFTFGIPVSDTQTFDLTYEKGSGAPNFNKGEQFSANLTVRF